MKKTSWTKQRNVTLRQTHKFLFLKQISVILTKFYHFRIILRETRREHFMNSLHEFTYPILSYYPMLSYPTLYSPILSYVIPSYPIPSYPILSYSILSFLNSLPEMSNNQLSNTIHFYNKETHPSLTHHLSPNRNLVLHLDVSLIFVKWSSQKVVVHPSSDLPVSRAQQKDWAR